MDSFKVNFNLDIVSYKNFDLTGGSIQKTSNDKMWDPILLKDPIIKEGKSSVTFEVINTLNMRAIKFGIIDPYLKLGEKSKEKSALDNINNNISYFNYSGEIFESGNYRTAGKPIFEGEVITVEVDYEETKVNFYINGKLQGSGQLGTKLIEGNIFFYVGMYHLNNEVKVISTSHTTAEQMK